VAAAEFIDYYEILEINPKANSETIERMFRYFAQRYHPDNPQTGDRSRFDVIVDAHNTLKDPVKRAQYDINFHIRSSARSKLVDEVNGTKIWQDVDLQKKLLSLESGTVAITVEGIDRANSEPERKSRGSGTMAATAPSRIAPIVAGVANSQIARARPAQASRAIKAKSTHSRRSRFKAALSPVGLTEIAWRG
jgi:curved DNA-binding protein CbpA